MESITTLAALKRRIKPGVKIKLIDTETMPGHKYLNVLRTIVKAQSNSFSIATDEQLAAGKNGSWMEYPKAAGFVGGGNSFRFIHEGCGYFDYELFETEKGEQ